MWNFFAARSQRDMEEEEAPSRHGAAVDMTTLDITYITHRLLGEVFLVFIYLFFFFSFDDGCLFQGF